MDTKRKNKLKQKITHPQTHKNPHTLPEDTSTTQTQIEQYLTDHHKHTIQKKYITYPDNNTLKIDYTTIEQHNINLADTLTDQPIETIKEIQKTCQTLHTKKTPHTLQIQITNLPPRHTLKNLRQITTKTIGKLYNIQGLVKRVGERTPTITTAYYECRGCLTPRMIPQTTPEILIEPGTCTGCGNKNWTLNLTKSTMKDIQNIKLYDSYQNLPKGQQPRSMTVQLEGTLIDTATPGDLINITGIPLIRHNKKTKKYHYYIQANHIHTLIKSFDDVEITESDEKKILELSTHPDIFIMLRDSIAPSVKGYDTIKEAIVCQLFGGTPKTLNDNTTLRHNSHILLIGDPGTGKTELLRFVSSFAPNGIFASGSGSSGVGLTAAAVRDEEGNWNLEAGTVVLGDKGFVCIDEMDKMGDHDRDAMHDVMERQIVNINKANIQADLPARTSILAAANPKGDNFDRYKSIREQINLPDTLLSRFDLIFVIEDKNDIETNKRVSNHIFQKHREGVVDYPVDVDLFRKYIAFARRNCNPLHSDESQAVIEDFYLSLRESAMDDDGVPIPVTPRQEEGLIRLAEAVAKAHLRDYVTREDSECAVGILVECLREVGLDRVSGRWDARLLGGMTGRSEFDRLNEVMRVLEDGFVDDYGVIGDYGGALDEVMSVFGVGRDEARRLVRGAEDLMNDKK